MPTLVQMRIIPLTIIFLAVVFGCFSTRVVQAYEDTFEVGVAKVDVTPDYPTRLNGFGFRREETADVAQQLWVKALAISKADEDPVVIFTIDNLGVRPPMVEKVVDALNDAFNIPRNNVMVTFTHTHCAPKVNGASDNIFGQPIPPAHQKHIDQYTNDLTSALIKAGKEAIENRKSCTLEWAVGDVGFAANRRTPGGPVDHELPVLVARDKDNKIFAIYTSYACHCTTLSYNKLHGDWAGCAQQTIERLFPGSTALVAIGAGSDSNPFPRGEVDHAAAHGNELASEVKRLIESDMIPLTGKISTTVESIVLPLKDPPSKEELKKTAKRQDAIGYNASVQLGRLNRGEKLTTQLDYPIQTLEFENELTMIFLAGEICVDYSLRLKKELNRDKIWVHGYCNDFVGYIPSERLLNEGGYGGGSEIMYFDWPSTLKHGMEQKIIDQVKKQVREKFHVPPGTQGVPPKTPKESIRHFNTHDRFRVELVACEPQVVDPVAIDFAPDGSVWVAEMPDYTRKVDEQFKQHGRVSRISDADGDGFYETSKVFTKGLRFPTDVKVWREGIIVCDAPDILYFEDTNGDGVADIKKQLFTGFATHNPHARVNSLRIGLDNWLYGSCGLFGGEITTFKGEKVQLGARDFRCNPDLGLIEPVSGKSQQGRVRDDLGNWFGCDNSDLLRHYPWFERQAENNPYVVPPGTRYSLARNHGLFAPKNLVTFKLSGVPGVATSACGIGIYRDELLGSDIKGNAFSCEPVNQLIHRVVLRPRSATFTGQRAQDESTREFLTSTDQWFRPVLVRTGPDGALWVVDMYRYVIEHPRWIPEETKGELNTFAGSQLGRIYRLVPKDKPLRESVNLEILSSRQLVDKLDTANGTERDLVQQLLVWRSAVDVVELLKQVATDAKTPTGRLQAICILDGLKSIDKSILSEALGDEHTGVRRHAVRIVETSGMSDVLVEDLLKLTGDQSAQVRMQVAYALGSCSDRRAQNAIADLLGKERDAFVIAAAFNSINGKNLDAIFSHYSNSFPVEAEHPDRGKTLVQLINMSGGFGTSEQIGQVFDWILKRPGKDREFENYLFAAALLTAMDRRQDQEKVNLNQEQARYIHELYQSAQKLLDEPEGDRDSILGAIELVGRKVGSHSQHVFQQASIKTDGSASQLLSSLVEPRMSPAIQRAAIRSITKIGDPKTPEQLLKCWPNASPAIREMIIDCLLSRDSWLDSLMTAIEKGRLARTEFPAAKRDRLLSHKNKDIVKRSKAIFAMSADSSDSGKMEQWKNVLALSAEAYRGHAVYKKHCSVCHPMQNQDMAVGPNLKAITTPTPQYILQAIVSPNLEVQQQFVQYNALMLDGRTVTGMLVSESAGSITLRTKDAKDVSLLRNEIDELKASRLSMMPEGMEKDIGRQQMADLIAAVIEMGKGPKSFPGNTPKIIAAQKDGSLKLEAVNAEVYGEEIVFENTSFKNIGYWHGSKDHIIWRVVSIQPGNYDVWINYACHDSVAGNEIVVDSGSSSTTFKVKGTGQWSNYQKVKIGTIKLSPNQSMILVRPQGQIKTSALIDLRTVLLVPEGVEPSW